MMEAALRDAMLRTGCFATPLDGLRQLGVKELELYTGPGWEVLALDANDWAVLDSAEAAQAYRAHLDELGLRVRALHTELDFGEGEPAEHAAWLADAIRLADTLGAACVRVGGPMRQDRRMTFADRLRIHAEVFNEAVAATPDHAAALALENAGPHLNNPVLLLNILLETDSDRVGLTVDPGSFYANGAPLSEVYGIVRLLTPYTRHVHVSNVAYPANARETARSRGWEYKTYVAPAPGGDLDYRRIADVLGDGGYRGVLCLEEAYLSRLPVEEHAALLERSAAWLKGITDRP